MSPPLGTSQNPIGALGLVNLTPLMEKSRGRNEICIGLIDGPVAVNHPDLASENIREISGKPTAACAETDSGACTHGTFVAGILHARRGSPAPAICPNCTLLLRPIFGETILARRQTLSAAPEELATAIIEIIRAGARVINISAALAQPSTRGEKELEESLNYAARHGAIVVAAAGNQGTVGSTTITRHPWVIPVIACDQHGWPAPKSNLSHSAGGRGLAAPGERITSLGTNATTYTFGGTSAATPFVTGAIALVWSEFPAATAADIKAAIARARTTRRRTIVPPLLNAWAVYKAMASTHATG